MAQVILVSNFVSDMKCTNNTRKYKDVRNVVLQILKMIAPDPQNSLNLRKHVGYQRLKYLKLKFNLAMFQL